MNKIDGVETQYKIIKNRKIKNKVRQREREKSREGEGEGQKGLKRSLRQTNFDLIFTVFTNNHENPKKSWSLERPMER